MTVERIRAITLQPRTRMVPTAAAGKRSRRAYETSVGTSQDRQRNALIVSMLAYALETLNDCICRNPLQMQSGRCWARTSDLRLVEAALSQLS